MTATESMEIAELSFADGGQTGGCREVPVEMPVAFEFSGLAYAVMLASPVNLQDYAVGFALSEGLIEQADDLADLDIAMVAGGAIIRAGLPDARATMLHERLRLRLSEGSCGLCGLQSIEEMLRPLPKASRPPHISTAALHSAIGALPQYQALSRVTGATHAAAFCSEQGAVIAVREDIGRHNALDKLIGHCLRNGVNMQTGFVLLTARCSYELVEKTVRAGCGLLLTISAPTSLAIKRARESGLTLVTLARSDSALVASDPHGVFA